MSNILVFLSVFFFMEFVANFTHRFMMHGFMWYWHEDHHVKSPGFFERNDIFFIIFASPSMFCTMYGYFAQIPWLLSIGLGILAYGIAYFLVHEVLIHRRFTWLDKFDNPYFRALKIAHHHHHGNFNKEGCRNFGMLWVPLEYFKDSFQKEYQTSLG